MDTPRNAKELDERDKLELLEFLGTEDLGDAITIEHTTRRLSEDEIWFIQAISFYDQVEKHPLTNQLHRKHASTLLWFLDHVTDEGLAREYKARIGHRDTKLADARSVFARLLEIMVEQRCLESLVNA